MRAPGFCSGIQPLCSSIQPLCSSIEPLCSLQIGLSHCSTASQFPSRWDGAGSPASISLLGAMTPFYEPERVHLSSGPVTSARAAPWPQVGPGTRLCHPALPLRPNLWLASKAEGHSPTEGNQPGHPRSPNPCCLCTGSVPWDTLQDCALSRQDKSTIIFTVALPTQPPTASPGATACPWLHSGAAASARKTSLQSK